MEWYEALALLLGSIVFLMALGMPVALAFLAANIVGAWIFMGGERGIVQLLNNGWGALTTFALVPIPLFLLMGEIFFHTGLGERMFNAIDRLLGKVPGRLSYVTVLGGTGFSTLSGSSMGSTALLGSLMVPEMNTARLQDPHVRRADPRHRRARDHHPALGARRAARHIGADRRGRAADRGRDSGAGAGGALYRDDPVPDLAAIRTRRRPTTWIR